MTIKELKEMINLMQEHGLVELEIERNGFKIKLKKASSGQIVQESIPSISPSREERPRQVTEAKAVDEPGVVVVRSPMVGTFYLAPAPDAEPYVSRGADVKAGDVLCIIEAMKLMNEIKSDISGRLTEILAENGQPVEFDQPLFKIQKG